jgi:tetratricopeptide (TPR) repeat protein
VERAETYLHDDPKVRRLNIILASLYARTGDSEKARMLLTETLEYWRGRVPPATSDLAQTLIELSKPSRLKGDHRHALAYAEEAVRVCRRTSLGHELQLAEAHHNLADVLAAQQHYRSALTEYHQAIQLCRNQPSGRRANMLLCGTLVDVAKLYKSQHKYRGAAEYCRQALEVCQRAPGKDPGALVGLHTALASLELADQRARTGAENGDELAQAEANIAAARKLCAEQGWLDGTRGIEILELEAVADVRHEKPGAAKQSLDKALELSRKAHLAMLENKILGELAQLQHGHALDPASKSSPAKD